MRALLLPVIRAAAVVVVALSGAGCGSSSSSPDPAAFAGTWRFQSGAIVPNCSGITLGNIDLTGDDVTITKTDATHISMVVASTGANCTVAFTVAGSVATVQPGQTCTIMSGGYSATLNVTAWTLSLTGDSIDMTMSGTAAVSIISCTPTSSGTMVRSSADAATAG